MASNYDLGIEYSNSAVPASSSSTKTRTANNELGKNEFLKILVAQMGNQDPLNPTSDTEWIAQMAQFSALEQMQEINSASQSQRAYSMIGKEITASSVVDSSGTTWAMDVYGNVTGVSKLNGVEYLVVYDYANEIEVLVPPSSVRTVFESTDATTTMQLENIYNLINKLLEAVDALTKKAEDGTGEVAADTTDGGNDNTVEDTGGSSGAGENTGSEDGV